MDSALLESAVAHGIFWVIAAVSAFWILGPAVMFALGRRRFSFELDEDPTAAEPRAGDPDYEKYYRQLYALGYRPVGRSVDTIKYFTPLHWRWVGGGSRLMQSQDRKTTVAFYRVAGQPLRYSATTLFDGGGALSTVFTAMKQNSKPAGNYRYVELLQSDPAQLLEEHAENVADFCERRSLTVKRASLREICEESMELGRRVIPKSFAVAMFTTVIFMYMLPAAQALRLLNHRDDFASWWMHPAVMLCGAALLFALMRFMMLPSRVPQLVRMLPLLALALVPMLLITRLDSGSETKRAIATALDQLEADADKGTPLEPAIDRVAALGAPACRGALTRMLKPSATPARKQALHQTLVRLNGADLGDTYEAWVPWCRTALRAGVTRRQPEAPAPAVQTPASSDIRNAAEGR